YVPTLCYLKDINEIGTCHICLVEMEGYNQLVAACDNITLRGMAVHTNTVVVQVTPAVHTAWGESLGAYP
ncbi:MAG: 2Fe-2S iron-sulfur cluster-binding protein, partial [Coriobacteriaceae bacterium]